MEKSKEQLIEEIVLLKERIVQLGILDKSQKQHVEMSFESLREAVHEKLVSAEQKYRSLLEEAAEGIIIADVVTKRFNYANPTICRWLGYSPEEFLKLDFAKLHPQEHLAHIEKEFYALARREKDETLDIPSLAKDGRIIYADVRGTGIMFEGRVCLLSFFTDTTKRKEAEEEGANAHRLLQRIIDILPIRVFWKDKDLRYLGCNESFAKDAGKNGPEDLIGRDDFQMAWKEQAEAYRDDDLRVLNSGKEKLNFEECQTTPGGNKIWLQTSKVPLTDNDGNLIGILGIFKDITERKQNEKKLADSASFAQKLLNSSPISMITYKASGEAVSANEAAAKLVGTSIENVKKQNFRELDSWKRSGFLEIAQKALDTGQEQSLESHTVSSYGVEFWIFARFIPFSFEGQPHLLLMAEDISEKKKTELALRDAEKKYYSILENSQDAIMTVDLSTKKYVYVNPAAVKLFGAKDQAELSSYTAAALSPQRQPDGSVSAEKALEMRKIALSDGVHLFEWVHRRINGEEFSAEVLLSRMGLDGGSVIQATVRDISERKRMEKDILEKMENVEKLNQFMIEREMRIIEIKKEVNKQSLELGRPEPYALL